MRRIAIIAACLLTVIGTIGIVGCSGKKVQQVGGDDQIPTDMGKELADKFEIKDLSSGALDAVPATAVPVAPVAEPPGKKKKKKTKKELKAEAEAAAAAAKKPAPFVWPQRRPAVEPIWVGEFHTFSVSYFSVTAGDFHIDVLPFKVVNGRKVYHIKGNALSSKVFSMFYRLNDTLESFIDYEGFFSHRFRLILDEKIQSRDALELYDSEKGETYYWNRWNHVDKGYSETKVTQPILPFSQDSLSALFYVRTLPLPDGAVITFPVASEGNNWEAVLTVVGREIMEWPYGRTPAIKIKVDAKFRGVLQKREDSFLWLSDDDRRFILRLEAKVKIGTVVAELTKLQFGDPPASP